MFTNTNLLLDDFRDEQMTFVASGNPIYLKEKWVIVKNYDEFMDYITKNGIPKLISFDHDLEDMDYFGDGSYSERTGKNCAEWLVNFCMDRNHPLPDYIIHSQNPQGGPRIKSVFDTYYKMKDRGLI